MSRPLLEEIVADPLVNRIQRIRGYVNTSDAAREAEQVRELAAEAVDAGVDPLEALELAMRSVFEGDDAEEF